MSNIGDISDINNINNQKKKITKIIVFSDSHGISYFMNRAIEEQKDADLYVHLGDGAVDFAAYCVEHSLPYAAVRGNCDGYGLAASKVLEVGGAKLFICHGHEYGVKYSTGELLNAATAQNADIAMFGHTHRPFEKYINGIYLFNPGSITYMSEVGRTYGIVHVVPQDSGRAAIVCNIVPLEP